MAKNDSKSSKENKHFFKDFKAEIKKVIWPTPKQLLNNTVAIVTMVIVVCVIVFVLDLAFDAVNKYGLTNLQKTVQNTVTTEESDDNTNTTIDSVTTESETNEVETDTANE